MKAPTFDQIDLLRLNGTVWIAEHKVGLAVYDFPFDIMLPCSRSMWGLDNITAISRCGAVDDYDAFYNELSSHGIQLIHSPAQHQLCSELPEWYPLLEGLTPASSWYDLAPSASEAEQLYGWPIFLKGSRQTSRHNAKLSIVRNSEEYDAAIAAFAGDSMLHWQQIVLRKFVPLRPVAADMGLKIPASYEFRTFWWRNQLVGAGPYFSEFASYDWTPKEKDDALQLAEDAANRVNLPFIVIDLAQTAEGKWIVIEINDAQESGYTGVIPIQMWQNIIELESVSEKSPIQKF